MGPNMEASEFVESDTNDLQTTELRTDNSLGSEGRRLRTREAHYKRFSGLGAPSKRPPASETNILNQRDHKYHETQYRRLLIYGPQYGQLSIPETRYKRLCVSMRPNAGDSLNP